MRSKRAAYVVGTSSFAGNPRALEFRAQPRGKHEAGVITLDPKTGANQHAELVGV